MATPNVWTVGTGMTYATISAAIAAAGTVNGDFINVYATAGNVYAEQVVFAPKYLCVVGMVPNQGLTITSANATTVTVNSYSYLSNFSIISTRAGGSNIVSLGSYATALALLISGSGAGLGLNNGLACIGGARAFNCIAYNVGIGMYGNLSGALGEVIHCGAFKCTTYGYGTNAAASFLTINCIGAGCGTADFRNDVNNVFDEDCVSADLSADGPGGVTGFATADFVNWAGNDFRISQTARLSSLARVPGQSKHSTDITGRRRPSREGVFYAGAYHCFEQPTWGVGELSGIA